MTKNRAKGRAPGRAGKAPKAEQFAASSQQETLLFCMLHADRATSNDWCFRPTTEDAQELLDFLCDIGGQTWAEIERAQTGTGRRHKKHHGQPIDTIETAAQEDIRRMKLDETFGDTIFRFRLGGEKRLWGFREDRTFHIVWWDAGHQVYRTEPN